MKNVILATAALVASASTLAAFDLTDTFSIDSEVKTWYNTTQSTWTAHYEVKPTYSLAAVPGMAVYVMNDGDLRDVKYDGVELGMEYTVDSGLVSPVLKAKVGYDEDWNRGDIFVGATFNF